MWNSQFIIGWHFYSGYLEEGELGDTASAPHPDRLEIDEAFGFVFRSKGWFGKMLLLDLFALLSVVLVGAFFCYGYLIEISRAVRRGERELPPWDQLGKKFVDGFLLGIAFLIWAIPLLILGGLLAGLIAAIGCTASESGEMTCNPNGLAVGLIVVLTIVLIALYILLFVLIPAIWAQFLDGGLGAALKVAAVFRRAVFKPGITLLVLVMYLATSSVASLGIIALFIGLLFTFPYAFFVQSHLYGQFARITDAAAS